MGHLYITALRLEFFSNTPTRNSFSFSALLSIGYYGFCTQNLFRCVEASWCVFRKSKVCGIFLCLPVPSLNCSYTKNVKKHSAGLSLVVDEVYVSFIEFRLFDIRDFNFSMISIFDNLCKVILIENYSIFFWANKYFNGRKKLFAIILLLFKTTLI